MEFGAIIIGDEILSGKRQDKHLAKVIELLKARGLELAWASPAPVGPVGRTRPARHPASPRGLSAGLGGGKRGRYALPRLTCGAMPFGYCALRGLRRAQ